MVKNYTMLQTLTSKSSPKIIPDPLIRFEGLWFAICTFRNSNTFLSFGPGLEKIVWPLLFLITYTSLGPPTGLKKTSKPQCHFVLNFFLPRLVSSYTYFVVIIFQYSDLPCYKSRTPLILGVHLNAFSAASSRNM